MFQVLFDALSHLPFLGQFNIPPYQPPQTPWYWPSRFVLIVLAIRAVFWVGKQFSNDNKTPPKPIRKPSKTPSAPSPAASTSSEPVVADAMPVVADSILVLKDGQELGPYDLEEVNRQLSTGAISAPDPAWHEGLSAWVPLTSIAGVVSAPPAHGLRPPPRPVYTAGLPEEAGGETLPSAPSGLLIGGYICAAGSLAFFPPVLGLAGIVCGALTIKRKQVNQGVTLLIVSFVCTVIGMCIGAAS